MAARHVFAEEELRTIQKARKQNRSKYIDRRLAVLELRAQGKSYREIAEITGFHPGYIGQLISKYKQNGLTELTENHYHGNHRNLTPEEERAFMKPFYDRVRSGETVDVKEVAAAYQAAVDHPVAPFQFYRVLHRHGWNKDQVKGQKQKPKKK